MVGAPFERAVAPIRSATVKNGRYVRRTGYRAYHVHLFACNRVHSPLSRSAMHSPHGIAYKTNFPLFTSMLFNYPEHMQRVSYQILRESSTKKFE